MKKKIINGLLFAVALVAATSSFVSCKDYEGDNYAELNEKYTALQAAYLAQVSAMKDYVLTSRYNSETGYSAAELAAKGTIKARLDELEEYQSELENDSFPKYAKLIHENNIAIAKAQGLAEQAQDLAERDSAYLRSLLAGWDNGGTLGDMVTEAAGLLTALKSDTAKYKFAYDTLSIYYTQWNEAVKVADSAWNFVNKGKVNVLGKDIEDLQEMATLYDDAVADLHERIDSLRNVVDDLKANLKKEVYGVEIQAAINPIYGTFAYPTGVESNILALYYGQAGQLGVKFPAADGQEAAYWANQTPCVTAGELEALSPKYFEAAPEAMLMDTNPGNAGTLYVTVNPSDAKFDGTMFTLRSSDNKVSKVQLSKLESTDDLLKWGYRRASANGFYKATATVSEADVKDVALSFNLKALKPQAQAMLEDWKSTSATDIAKLGLAVLTTMKTDVPRLGVQYQWKDYNGEWKNYVSKYDLAAVSVRPVGYKFLDDLTGKLSEQVIKIRNQVTAKEKAFSMELINQIAQMIVVNIAWPNEVTTVPTVDGVYTIDGADGKKHVYMRVTFSASTALPAATVTVDNGAWGNVWGQDIPNHADGHITIEIPQITAGATKDIEITELFTSIAGSIQQALSGIKDKASTTITDYMNKFINVQNKVFNKVASVVDNPNRYVQPALIASTESLGFFYPSRIYFTPTQVKKGTAISFYPTTLTAEVLAPAFKKYVAITGVWKVDDMSATKAPKAFNTGVLNRVIDGKAYNLQNPFQFNTNDLESGYVYEFTYECLDYTGLVAGKKYYIEIFD